MTKEFRDDPWSCDAGTMTWCHRPRLYWISWSLCAQQGADLVIKGDGVPHQVTLQANQNLEQFVQRRVD